MFEPYPPFYEWLQQETKDMSNVNVNAYGLGDQTCELYYNAVTQKMTLYPDVGDIYILPIKTLNWYIKENKIDRIDFLKIDAEQMDYRVLLGGTDAIRIAKYIQFETWDAYENEIMWKLLKDDFYMDDIGFRNVFCTRK